jgi:hypothetical protein
MRSDLIALFCFLPYSLQWFAYLAMSALSAHALLQNIELLLESMLRLLKKFK